MLIGSLPDLSGILRYLTIGALTVLLTALLCFGILFYLVAVYAFWTLIYGFIGFIGLNLGIGLSLAAISLLKRNRKPLEA